MIEIKNLHKAFDENKVLSGIDLTIPTGDTICIIGKSGSGKSVLLKNIVGLITPDEGTVHIDSIDVNSLNYKQLSRVRTKMGFVFQGAALFDSMTVFENVVLGQYEHGIREIEHLKNEAMRVLSYVGLLPDLSEKESMQFQKEWNILKDSKPSDLSGGMKKRVGVARALVGEPEYIFYDEPTTGLDPVNSEQIDKLIAELTERLSATSLVITHDMFSVFKVARSVAMLHDGKVHFNGTVEELKNSNDPIVYEFLERFVKV
jgi:phospholipid/cholesterol/gamma-HCH transport system ATP-binding protein